MTKWEYTIIEKIHEWRPGNGPGTGWVELVYITNPDGDRLEASSPSIARQLSFRGKAGWELVSVVVTKESGQMDGGGGTRGRADRLEYYLKRPVSD